MLYDLLEKRGEWLSIAGHKGFVVFRFAYDSFQPGA